MLKVVDRMLEWDNAGSDKLLSVGYTLRPPELLFKQVENDRGNRTGGETPRRVKTGHGCRRGSCACRGRSATCPGKT